MSKETIKDLNNNVLVGMTDKRGKAWHYRASDQGAESNHYTGAIPVADVQRRLFHWTAVERPLSMTVPCDDISTMTGWDDSGDMVLAVTLPEHKAIVRSDTNALMGIFKSGYQCHQYDEWLIGTVANILDDTLSITSAGLLKGGAVAWVEVSVPDTITGPAGVEFRPNLLACTSFDGSLATTFKRTVQATVCDNTLAVAMSEKGQQFKARHSKYSGMRLADAREALNIVYNTADAFTAQVEQLVNQKITDVQFKTVIEQLIPADNSMGKRGVTLANNKRGEINRLYRFDERVAPWYGTGFGVVQAFNTWEHHVKATRGSTDRAERNMMAAINGDTDKADAEVMRVLAGV